MTPPLLPARTVGSVMDYPIRLLLVDDEARVRRGLRMCMDGEPDFEVVGEAEEGGAAIALASALHPDIVVLDLRMRGMGGMEAAGELASARPATCVVILSLQDDVKTRAEAMASGAAAFVGKQEGIARLFEVIRDVAGAARAS